MMRANVRVDFRKRNLEITKPLVIVSNREELKRYDK